MNRLLSTLFWCMALPSVAFSQNLERCIEVVSSTGNHATRNNRKYTYTVGEPVVLTLRASRHKLTQGFHQPELCRTVSTTNLDISDWGIEVFPNPTADWLNVRFDAGKGSGLRVSVLNLLGQTLLRDQALNPDGLSLDCSSWHSGIYLLSVRDPKTNATGVLRFVKL